MPPVDEADTAFVERGVHHLAMAIDVEPAAHAGIAIILSIGPARNDVLVRQPPGLIKGGDIDPDDRVRRFILPPLGKRFVLPKNDVFAHHQPLCVSTMRPLEGLRLDGVNPEPSKRNPLYSHNRDGFLPITRRDVFRNGLPASNFLASPR